MDYPELMKSVQELLKLTTKTQLDWIHRILIHMLDI
jgi:hypothetical protein